MPDGLKAYLAGYPYHDPGREEVWEGADEIEVEGNLLQVIRLNPAGDPPRPPKDSGWRSRSVRSRSACRPCRRRAMRGKGRPPACVSCHEQNRTCRGRTCRKRSASPSRVDPTCSGGRTSRSGTRARARPESATPPWG